MKDEISEVRGYRLISEARKQDDDRDLYAFLSIFHPEMKDDEKMKVVNAQISKENK